MTPPIRMVGPSGEKIVPALLDTTGASVGDVLAVLTGPVAGFAPPSSVYNDEQAQDAVGSILDDSGDIDFTYVDATPAISAVVKNDAVTFAKMQNIATARILGRDTASSGDIEELTAAEVVTLLSTALPVGFAFDFPAQVSEFVLRPLPFAGTFTKWWARRDGTGDATWTIEYAVSVTAAFASVGGTQPSITAAEGNSDTNGLDWTTLTFVEGGVLRVTLTGFTGAGTTAGLTIGATRS